MKPYIVSLVFLWVAISFNSSCKSDNKPPMDTESNKYFSTYRDIYNSYGVLPADSTKKQLELYLEEFPENADGWAFYGNVCFKAGDYAAARVSYGKAIALDGKKGMYYSWLGNVYNAENKLDSAEKYLLQAVELKDTSSHTLLNLAMLYCKKQDTTRCTAFADAAALLKDNSPLVPAGLSYVYMKLGETGKSNTMLKEATALGLKDTAGLNEVLAGRMTIEDFYRKNN